MSNLVQQADQLVIKYATDTAWHLKQVGWLMRYFAEKLGEDADYRYSVWLLHDIDWDIVEKDWSKHIKTELDRIIGDLEIEDTLREQLKLDIRSHGPWLSGVEPTTLIQKYLISIDESSGLMFAYARMRSGFEGMEAAGVLKKIKDTKFAAGVDREHVRNCEKYLDISLDEFIKDMIVGFQGLAK